jgi:hypothetical protein
MNRLKDRRARVVKVVLQEHRVQQTHSFYFVIELSHQQISTLKFSSHLSFLTPGTTDF